MALSDYQARQIIINELKKNIFVVAGAGSGKTSILITRMVRMVEEGYDITKFCTITFTVNAAAEFLSKFRSDLQKRSEQTYDQYQLDKYKLLPPPTEITRTRCKEALKNIDLAFMGTIDSFCQKLVSEHPYEAQVPSSSSVISAEQLVGLYQKEFDNIVNRVGDYNDENLQNYLTDFLKINKDPLKTFQLAINDVINASCLNIQLQLSYDHSLNLEDKHKQVISLYQENLLSDLREIYQHCEKAINFSSDLAICEDSRKAWQNFIKYKSLLLGPWNINNTAAVAYQIQKLVGELKFSDDPELFLTKPFNVFEFKKSVKYKNQKVSFYKLFVSKDELSDTQLLKQEIDNLAYDYSLPFLIRASSLIQQKFKKEGKLSFNQWLLCIKEVLEEDKKKKGKLIEHITDRYQYFMLDESQDTSPFQTKIFELLTKQNKDKCTLFIVGDPKQSIYRFRGADEQSYLETRNNYQAIQNPEETDFYDDIQVELLRNFRSSKELRQYFNDSFAAMDNYTPIEISFEEEDSLFQSGAYGYDSSEFVNIIKGMIDNSNYQTFDHNKKCFRTLKYRDFMVITYTTTHQEDVVEALSQENIPFYLEGNNDLSRYDLIKASYAIYAYVANQNQATYLNLLNSSFFGLTPEESLMVVKQNNHISIIENKEMQINFVNQLVDESNSFTPLSLFNRIAENLALFEAEKIEKIDYLYFVEEKIKEALTNGNISSLADGELFLRNYLSSKIDRCSPISYKPNAVYIANLHKVKGLERPVVILIKAGQATKPPASRLDFKNNKSFLFQIAKMDNGVVPYYLLNSSSSSFSEQREEEKNTLKNEKNRLLYVAATRAKDYLLIPRDAQAWKSLPSDKDFVLLDRKDEDTPTSITTKKFECHQINAHFDSRYVYRLEKPSSFDNEYKMKKPKDEIFEDLVATQSDSEATKMGTAVHRLMERIALSLPNKVEQKDVVKAILDEYDLETGSSFESVLNSVFETIICEHGYLQEKENAPKDIYEILSNAKEIMCEVPFCYKEGMNLFNGFIDLIYLDSDGYHIIDYKTDAQLGEHKAQLDAYVKALKVLFDIEADAKIYHIKIK